MMTLAELNRVNGEFWNEHAVLMKWLLPRRKLVQIAMDVHTSRLELASQTTTEADRLEQLKRCGTFEAELLTAATACLESPSLVVAQRARAKKLRGKTTDDGRAVYELIQELALAVEHRETSSRDLWPHLYSKLDGLCLDPKERKTKQGHPAYRYEFGKAHKQISYGRFEKLVRESRSKSGRR